MHRSGTPNQRLSRPSTGPANRSRPGRGPAPWWCGPGRCRPATRHHRLDPVAAHPGGLHHGPADLRLAVLSHHDRVSEWRWVWWLPHVMARSGRRLLAATAADADVVVSELDGRDLRTHHRGGGHRATTRLRRALSAPFLNGGTVSAIAIAEVPDRLPSLSSTVVSTDGIRLRVESPGRGEVIEGVTPLLASRRGCRRSGPTRWRLSKTRSGPTLKARSPKPSGYSSCLGCPIPTRRRWPAPGEASGSTVRAPIGSAANRPLEIDLVTDGPHGLLVGHHRRREERAATDHGCLARRPGRPRAPQLRPHRLQGRQRVRRLCRPPPCGRRRHRPRRAPRPPRPHLSRGRAAPPGASVTGGRGPGSPHLPGRRPPTATSPAAHRHRRVRRHGQGASRVHGCSGGHRRPRPQPRCPPAAGHTAAGGGDQGQHPRQQQPAALAAGAEHHRLEGCDRRCRRGQPAPLAPRKRLCPLWAI